MKRPRQNLLVVTTKNFLRHNDTDLAAALTYYAVFAILPAVLALLSLLAVIGNPDDTIATVLDVLRPLMSADRLADVEPVLEKLSRANGAGWTLAAGAAGALYSASAYVGGFSRAMNTVREVEETRPFWKLRPLMLLITLVAVVLNAVGLVIITVSGPIAASVGDKLGVEKSAVDLWDVAKWPGLALIAVVVVALLFHATPNVRSGRVRLLSPGAFTALLIWAVLSTGFAFYVANFSSYNKTYGSVAAVIIALLWIWLTNVALLFGAELDAVRDARIAAAPPKVKVNGKTASEADGMFPHAPGTPVYGPQPQPVPHED
ncbi:MAG: YihY/virulence factor BrkB family protein [Propionibacteriales bacterium]|nr:YihY/virulence factor BrkB family protein [Propionibacteriales bacterium]